MYRDAKCPSPCHARRRHGYGGEVHAGCSPGWRRWCLRVLAALSLWHHLPSHSPVLSKVFSLLSEPWGIEVCPCVEQKAPPWPPAGASIASLGVSGVSSPYEFPSPCLHFKEHFLSLCEKINFWSCLPRSGPVWKRFWFTSLCSLEMPRHSRYWGMVWQSLELFLSVLNNWKKSVIFFIKNSFGSGEVSEDVIS